MNDMAAQGLKYTGIKQVDEYAAKYRVELGTPKVPGASRPCFWVNEHT